jgi:hypothetical protein
MQLKINTKQIMEGKMGGTRSMHGETKNAYKILVGKPEGKNHLADLRVDGRIISK